MIKLIEFATKNSNEIEQTYDYYDKLRTIRNERRKGDLKWRK